MKINNTMARIALMAALSAGVPSANAALVHLYTFSGPTVLDSVGGVNGTLIGGALIAGGALSVDGNGDYAELAGKIIPGAGDFTVSLKAQARRLVSGHVELISQGQSGSGFYIGYNPSGIIRITDFGMSTTIAYPTDGAFHTFTLSVGAGSSGSFYIDGVLQGIHTVARGSTGTNTRFGEQFEPWDEYFDGLIDDVAVYDTALDAAAVMAIARNGPAPGPAPVPEPGTLALLATAFGAMAFKPKKKSSASK